MQIRDERKRSKQITQPRATEPSKERRTRDDCEREAPKSVRLSRSPQNKIQERDAALRSVSPSCWHHRCSFSPRCLARYRRAGVHRRTSQSEQAPQLARMQQRQETLRRHLRSATSRAPCRPCRPCCPPDCPSSACCVRVDQSVDQNRPHQNARSDRRTQRW